MTNLDSITKSRDTALSIKVHLVKAMVFPVVMYGCESWIIKKAESQRIDDQPRQHIKRQRHYFANKGPSSQGYGFSSGHVWV